MSKTKHVYVHSAENNPKFFYDVANIAAKHFLVYSSSKYISMKTKRPCIRKQEKPIYGVSILFTYSGLGYADRKSSFLKALREYNSKKYRADYKVTFSE